MILQVLRGPQYPLHTYTYYSTRIFYHLFHRMEQGSWFWLIIFFMYCNDNFLLSYVGVAWPLKLCRMLYGLYFKNKFLLLDINM